MLDKSAADASRWLRYLRACRTLAPQAQEVAGLPYYAPERSALLVDNTATILCK